MQKQHSNLSSMTQSQPEKLDNHDYEEDDNYDDDGDDDGLEQTKESEENLRNNHRDDIDVNEDFISNINETDNEKNIDDYYEETPKTEVCK